MPVPQSRDRRPHEQADAEGTPAVSSMGAHTLEKPWRGAELRGRFTAVSGREAPVLRYAILVVIVLGALIAGVVLVLNRNETRNQWQQSVTELSSASHVAASGFLTAKADLRAKTSQVATSLAVQRAVVEHDDEALGAIARAEHARINVGSRTFGTLPGGPQVTATAAITDGTKVLAQVTLSLPFGSDLLVLMRETTPLQHHSALLLTRRGRVIAGGPIGAPAIVRNNRVTFGKTTFAAAAAPLGAAGVSVYAVQPAAGIDALTAPYRRLLFYAAAVTFAVALAGATRLGRPLARLVGEVSRLRRQAQTDPLTGLSNRAALDERLHSELEHADRYSTSVSLVLADIDNFKQINDTHGHQAGDEVLRAVGRALIESCREIDLAARFGGEEFALVLPGSQLADARRVAERVRKTLESISVPNGDGTTLHVTASLGAASFPTYRNADALLAAADSALYEAKRNGKNQVVTASSHRKKQFALAESAL